MNKAVQNDPNMNGDAKCLILFFPFFFPSFTLTMGCVVIPTILNT